MLNHDPQVEHCLETLCIQGCRQVKVIITVLESGKPLPHCHLSPAQYTLLLQELKSIMAVYEQTGSCSL